MIRKLSVLLIYVFLLVSFLCVFIFSTETGLLLTKKMINKFFKPFFTIEEVSGRLIGEWSLTGLEINTPAVRVTVAQAECRFNPAKLLTGELRFAGLTGSGVEVTIKDVEEEPLPDTSFEVPSILFPFAFAIENVGIEKFNIKADDGSEILQIDSAGFQLRGQGTQLSLKDFFIKGTDFALNLHGYVDLNQSWDLDILGRYSFSGHGYEYMAGTFSVNGPINSPALHLGMNQPAAIRLAGSVSNLLQDPEWNIVLSGKDVDLSTFNALWPQIKLASADINLSGSIAGYSGDVTAKAGWQDLQNIQLSSVLSGDWQGIDFKTLGLTLGDEMVVATDSGISWADTFSWYGQFIFENFNPEIIYAELPGKLNGELNSRGKVVADGVEASFDIVRLKGTFRNQQISIRGQVFLGETEVYSDGLLVESGDFQGSAFLQQGSFSWADAMSWSGDISLENFDPSFFYPELPGLVSGQITGAGTKTDTGYTGHLALQQLSGSLLGQPLTGQGDLKFENGAFKTKGINIHLGESELQLNGTAGENYGLDFSLLDFDLGKIAAQGGGVISITGKVAGSRQQPQFDLSILGNKLSYGSQSLSSLQASVRGDLQAEGSFKGSVEAEGIVASGLNINRVTVGLDGELNEHQVSVQLSSDYGEVQLVVSGGYAEKLWQGEIRDLSLRSVYYGGWEQEQPALLSGGGSGFELAGLCLADGEGRFCLAGKFDSSAENPEWQVESSLKGLVLPWLNRLQLVAMPVNGVMNAQLEAKGDSEGISSAKVWLELPEADFQLSRDDEEPYQVIFDDTSFSGILTDGRFQGKFFTSMANGGTLQMSTELDNVGQFSFLPSEYLITGEAKISDFNVAVLAPLTGFAVEPVGKMNGSFSLAGSLNRPKISGKIHLTDGGVVLPRQGVTLEHIKLSMSTTEDGATIRGEALSGTGKVVATGIVRQDEQGISGDIAVQGEDFLLLSLPEYEITVSSDVRFVFDKDKGKLTGKVVIPKAKIAPEELTSSVSVSDDVILINGDEQIEKKQWPVYANISVQLGQEVYIDGYGLKGRVQGGLQIEDKPGSFTTATGELDLIDGKFEVFGRAFDLERGRVLFTGGPIDNPGIDVRAQKEVSAEEAKGEGYVVGVDVNGLVQNLQFTLFSNPFMEDADILSHLLVGHSLAGSSADEGNILGNAVVALGLKGGTEIFKQLGSILSVDDLHLEGSTETEDVSLVVGKRITKDLYLGYDMNMFSQQGVFRVRYGLDRGFSVETQTSAESTGADLLYSFER